jgi:hypothetical protein
MKLDLSNRGYQAAMLALCILGTAIANGLNTTALIVGIASAVPAAVALTFRAISR